MSGKTVLTENGSGHTSVRGIAASGSSGNLAIAVDLGTTTIAASLSVMDTGEKLLCRGMLNPQRDFGSDVVARMAAAARSPAELEAMSGVVNAAVEELAADLLSRAGRSWDDLRRIAVAGNPAMEHLMLGLPVASLVKPPYRPLFTGLHEIDTRDLGWKHRLPLTSFPLPGGFVGGDMVAFLYGAGLGDNDLPVNSGARLFLDLGTNAEMALSAGETIYATSAAAGPAFEGGNLSCGMAAVMGAVNGVRIDGGQVGLSVIGSVRPAGICGSGVLETIVELLDKGLLDQGGRLLAAAEIDSNLANRIEEAGEERRFVLYRDAAGPVFVSQSDIRQVQLAMAAVKGGMEVIRGRAGLRWEDVAEVVVTGSFGAVLSPELLKNVGFLPANMVANISFIHEGALAGVEKALRVPEGFGAVSRLAGRLKVVPLSGTPDFARHFMAAMDFPADIR